MNAEERRVRFRLRGNCESARREKEVSDPRDKRSDNEHPINTGHPNVAPDGQYPPEEKTIGEITGAVAPVANAGVTTPSGSRDNRSGGRPGSHKGGRDCRVGLQP